MNISKQGKLLSLAVVGTVLTVSHAARADSLDLGDKVTATLDGTYLGGSSAPGLYSIGLGYNLPSNVNGSGAAAEQGSSVYYAGEIYWDNAVVTNSSGGSKSIPNNSFTTFCTELSTDVYIGSSYSYTVSDLSAINDLAGSKVGGTAATTAIEEVIYGAEQNGLGSATLSVAQAADAGAQAAIWKVLYDYNGSAGSLTTNGLITLGTGATGSWQADAAQDLTYVGNSSDSYVPMYGLKSAGTYQNQSILAVENPSFTPATTPTPKSLFGGVVLLGMLGTVGFFRRSGGALVRVSA